MGVCHTGMKLTSVTDVNAIFEKPQQFFQCLTTKELSQMENTFSHGKLFWSAKPGNEVTSSTIFTDNI